MQLSEELLTCRGILLPASPSLCLQNEFLTLSSTDFQDEMFSKAAAEEVPSFCSGVQADVHVRTVVRKEPQHLFKILSSCFQTTDKSPSCVHDVADSLFDYGADLVLRLLLSFSLRSDAEFLEQR